ncbi:MAG: MBOAT family protein [Lachnospiraceae bacterium]|nr:MBOAT family protein [Lachnospiraceae bacterium]
MSFSDLSFIFRFLPLFLVTYYIAPAYLRRFVLLCASLLFYALGDAHYFALLIFLTIVNHLLGIQAAAHRRIFCALAVILDAELLIAFKLLGTALGASFLPVGISFYTFKMISYQVDLYRGKVSPRPTPLDTATYFTLFAQVTSGPIMRYPEYAASVLWHPSALMSAKDRRLFCLDRLEDGAFYFCTGLAFKVLIADHLAMCWRQIGTIGYAHLSTPLAWIGVLCYALNLYFDFWGFSLMASGLTCALGFSFIENFHHPYAAKGVADFYRRWHMTLGSWFRDYVYIPLGGSRKGAFFTIRNLLLVWIMTALWHGISVTFLIWGMVLFLLIVLEKYVTSRLPGILSSCLMRLHVWVLVPLSWIPFAMNSFDHLGGYMHRLFPFAHLPANVYAKDYVSVVQNYWPFLLAGLVFLIPAVYDTMEKKRRHPLTAIVLLAAFWCSVYSLAGTDANPFMYFRF